MFISVIFSSFPGIQSNTSKAKTRDIFYNLQPEALAKQGVSRIPGAFRTEHVLIFDLWGKWLTIDS